MFRSSIRCEDVIDGERLMAILLFSSTLSVLNPHLSFEPNYLLIYMKILAIAIGEL